MNVPSRTDLGYRTPYIVTVFQNCGFLLQLRESDFVPQGHGIKRGQRDRLVGFHDPSAKFLAGMNIFDDDHADVVSFIMHNKINGHLSSGGKAGAK
jgi:hypothetical protein